MSPALPTFSIVSAVYNVLPYLDAFIASVERQTIDAGRLDVVLVDDGSTDGSRGVIDAWAARRPDLVRVVGKANGGQASARNLGLEHARGSWVTFSDPDDMLHPAFFERADAFLARHPGVELLGAQPIVLEERSGERRPHARVRQYEPGARLVDLREDPNVFPGGTNITVFRRDVIEAANLRFDELLRPVFEDVHFTARYLLALPAPVVGIVPEMRYVYRQRATNDSTLQRGWSDPGRFTTVLERGHLDLLRQSGAAPWVQCLAIYDLSWYLWEDERTGNRIQMEPGVRAQFLRLLDEVIGHLQPDVVGAYRARHMKRRWRVLLAHGRGDRTWRADTVAITKVDPAMGLQRAVLAYGGSPPEVRFEREGETVEAAWIKQTAVRYFGVTWHHEHLAWIPDRRGTRAIVDGAPMPIGTGGSARRSRRPSPSSALGVLRRRLRGPATNDKYSEWAEAVGRRPGLFLAHTPLYRRFRDAWVLMDRADAAGDNAERLFEHLRTSRPDINAWFTVERDTPAWRRLRARYGTRVVALGSNDWLMLMLNAAWLLTSHADQDVMSPKDVTEATVGRTYKIGFLQHGVTQQDLSKWLNRRDFDFAAATTEPERRSIVEDGSAYIYTDREVRATGMPRYDRLLRLAQDVPVNERTVVLLAPTWRKWLVARGEAEGDGPSLDDVRDSDYLRSWRAVVHSERIAAAVRDHGLELAIMPHPNLASLLPALELPTGFRVFSFAEDDPQAIYARLALMVTDYSSVAFDAAALDRPVVYFQFDRDTFFAGGHIGAAGYFEYERDGFGPVTLDLPSLEAAVVEAIERGPAPSPEVQARIDATFVLRDGQACARVVAAVEELSRPYDARRSMRAGRRQAGAAVSTSE